MASRIKKIERQVRHFGEAEYIVVKVCSHIVCRLLPPLLNVIFLLSPE